jgi:hypothetical protein
METAVGGQGGDRGAPVLSAVCSSGVYQRGITPVDHLPQMLFGNSWVCG